MESFEFDLIGYTNRDSDELVEEVFPVCDYCTVSETKGMLTFSCNSEDVEGATTLREAIELTIAALQKVEGLFLVSIEPRDLVTASEIATRLGKSREYIRQCIAGNSTKNPFPYPVTGNGDKSSLWSWQDVAIWAVKKEYLEPSAVAHARVIRDYWLNAVSEQSLTASPRPKEKRVKPSSSSKAVATVEP